MQSMELLTQAQGKALGGRGVREKEVSSEGVKVNLGKRGVLREVVLVLLPLFLMILPHL